MGQTVRSTREVRDEEIISTASFDGCLAFNKRCATCGKQRWVGFWAKQFCFTSSFEDGRTREEVRYYCGAVCEWEIDKKDEA